MDQRILQPCCCYIRVRAAWGRLFSSNKPIVSQPFSNGSKGRVSVNCLQIVLVRPWNASSLLLCSPRLRQPAETSRKPVICLQICWERTLSASLPLACLAIDLAVPKAPDPKGCWILQWPQPSKRQLLVSDTYTLQSRMWNKPAKLISHSSCHAFTRP